MAFVSLSVGRDAMPRRGGWIEECGAVAASFSLSSFFPHSGKQKPSSSPSARPGVKQELSPSATPSPPPPPPSPLHQLPSLPSPAPQLPKLPCPPSTCSPLHLPLPPHQTARQAPPPTCQPSWRTSTASKGWMRTRRTMLRSMTAPRPSLLARRPPRLVVGRRRRPPAPPRSPPTPSRSSTG